MCTESVRKLRSPSSGKVSPTHRDEAHDEAGQAWSGARDHVSHLQIYKEGLINLCPKGRMEDERRVSFIAHA